MQIRFSIKRGTDIILSLFLIVMTIPLWALIASVIIIVDGRPVILRMERCARNGDSFKQMKFRTMYNGDYKFTDFMGDNRVIPQLEIVRKLNLDSLPELVSVVRGDMSLVGPRPFPMPLIEMLGRWPDKIEKRQSVRPGLTGLAQVELTKYDSARQKLTYDVRYVDNYSLLLDVKIIAKTLAKTLLVRWNEHEKK